MHPGLTGEPTPAPEAARGIAIGAAETSSRAAWRAGRPAAGPIQPA